MSGGLSSSYMHLPTGLLSILTTWRRRASLREGERERGEERGGDCDLALSSHTPPCPQYPAGHTSRRGRAALDAKLVAATLIFISQVVKQKRGLLPRRHPRLSARWALCPAVRCGTPGGTSDRANVQRLFSERSPWETRARYALGMTQWLLKRGPFYSLSRRLSGGSRD